MIGSRRNNRLIVFCHIPKTAGMAVSYLLRRHFGFRHIQVTGWRLGSRYRARDLRFDPFLHLRFDGDSKRNEEIKSERLSPKEIITLERSDPEKSESLRKQCAKLICAEFSDDTCCHLFRCGAGNDSFALSYDGLFHLCSSLWHPDCVYDLRKGSLTDAWRNFAPKVRDLRSNRKEFLKKCRVCPIINLCMWCPAHAYLEAGKMDIPVDYFCRTAHIRAGMLR